MVEIDGSQQKAVQRKNFEEEPETEYRRAAILLWRASDENLVTLKLEVDLFQALGPPFQESHTTSPLSRLSTWWK